MSSATASISLTQRIVARPVRRRKAAAIDRGIARRVQHAFEREASAAPVGGLRFYTRASRVWIYGTVSGQSEREAVLSLVQQVPGVVRVIDRMQRVVAPYPVDVPTGA